MSSNISSPTPRSRTPPDVKWLLNERAALRGQALGLRKAVRMQQDKADALRRQASELESQFIAPGLNTLAALTSRIDALAKSLTLVNSAVNPDAVEPVRAWAGRYGQRGALIALVRETVLHAGPGGIATTMLYDTAKAAFGLSFNLRHEERSFQSIIRHHLRELMSRDGLIEVLSAGGRGSSTIWRAKPLPALSDLQVLAESAAAERADERRTNADAL